MQIPILMDIYGEISTTYYSREQLRLWGYVGEIVFGIYYNHVKKQETVKTKELRIVKINNTDRVAELLPAFSQNDIPIVVSSSDAYAPFLSVVIQSIMDNSSKENNYDLIVLTKDIIESNKKTLQEMIFTHRNFSLRFVNASKYISNRSLHIAMHITPMTYLRLAVFDILGHFDKAIYLDCDIVVNADIAELYSVNLEKCYVGAALDTVMAGWCNVPGNPQIKYNEKTVGLKRKFEYFNAGVLVINLKAFRKDYSTDALFNIASSKDWNWFDQDVLNKVCEGKVKIVENEWNVMAHKHDFEYQLAEFFAPYSIYKNYIKALAAPKIIHYAGRVLPCFVPDVDLAFIFWKYARKTPYYEMILAAMSSNQIGAKFNLLADPRSGARKLADKLLPPGTRRRKFAKMLLPKGSLRWRFCKQIYYIFRPKYRPKKEVEIEDTIEADED